VGLGVPGLSVLSDLERLTVSENEPDLFLAALMGTLRELLLDMREDISLPLLDNFHPSWRFCVTSL